MNRRSIRIVHLVKLVDKAHAAVGEHQGAALEGPLAGHGITMNRCSETDRRGALASRINGAMARLFDIFEELTLGGTGVTE